MGLIDELIWLTLPFFYIVGMVAIFGLPIVFTVFWKKWMPKPARALFWAARRSTPPLLLVHDSGRGEITSITERKGEGIVITEQGKYKILPRWLPKMPLSGMLDGSAAAATPPLASNGQIVPSEDEAAGMGEAAAQDTTGKPHAPAALTKEVELESVLNINLLKENFLLDYSDWVVKRTNLIGMNMPFFVGYTGKLCLLNPEALALYEAGDMMIKSADGDLFNPHNAQGKTKENALQPLLLMDARKIQQIIYDGYDQSQIAAVVADSEEIARLGQGISPKMKMIFAIIAIAIIAVLAIMFLPQLLGGGQKQQSASMMGALILLGLKKIFRRHQ